MTSSTVKTTTTKSPKKPPKTGPSKTGPSKTGPSKTGPSTAGPSKTAPSKTGPAKGAPSKDSAKTSPFDVLTADFIGALGPTSDPTSLPTTAIEVAFAGRSNVGKSSLINVLVQRKGLVRTSSTPGCTRQINLFSARTRSDVNVTLVDLPGYGFAKRSRAERTEWAELIEGFISKRPTLRVLVLIVDLRRGLEDDDLELIEFARSARAKKLQPIQPVLVATKMDRAPPSSRRAILTKLAASLKVPIIGFSSVTREGRDELWRAIVREVAGQPETDAPSDDAVAIAES